MTCPHCEHGWSYHRPLRDGTSRCTTCGCRWSKPFEPPPPPTERQLLVAKVENAFWEAADRLCETYEGFDTPYFDRYMDMIDTSGGGMPGVFWEHLTDTLSSILEGTAIHDVQ